MRDKFFIFLFCVAGSATAQTVQSREETARIKGDALKGYAVTLAAPRGAVESAWQKQIKELGKFRSSSDYYFVTDPVIEGTAYPKGIVYARTDGSDGQVTVWVGIKDTEWSEGEAATVRKELAQWPYRFAVKFYRDQVQGQIDEAQRALDATERQYQRAVNQSKDLATKLTNNENENARLKRALEANALENAVLKQKIIDNKKAQDSIAQASQQILKVLEAQKEKQRKIN